VYCSKCRGYTYLTKILLTIKGSDKSLTLKVPTYVCNRCKKMTFKKEVIDRLEKIRLALTHQVYPI
jgi:hypothetical protein